MKMIRLRATVASACNLYTHTHTHTQRDVTNSCIQVTLDQVSRIYTSHASLASDLMMKSRLARSLARSLRCSDVQIAIPDQGDHYLSGN